MVYWRMKHYLICMFFRCLSIESHDIWKQIGKAMGEKEMEEWENINTRF